MELTWTNKHERLLAHDDGSYEWLPPTDYRVAEVRLLDDVETIGDVGRRRAADNLLIRGDALHALTSLTNLPEFAGEYVGKVKLAYLDPPFNTGQAFEHYDDALEHSVWLTMIRDRIAQIVPLLSDDGSLWVHADDSEQHRLRCVLDEILGTSAFVSTVVWQKRYSRDNRPAIGPVHDYIHVYSAEPGAFKERRNRIVRDEKSRRQYRNPNNDPRGPWRAIPITAQAGHATASQFYDITLPSGRIVDAPPGNSWRFSKDRFDELNEKGRIYFGLNGDGMPNTIRYLDEDEGLVPWSSVSEILTEQTLGRGMRLPFGQYTGVEILDTLEVIAHERYEELLKKAGVLNEAFV